MVRWRLSATVTGVAVRPFCVDSDMVVVGFEVVVAVGCCLSGMMRPSATIPKITPAMPRTMYSTGSREAFGAVDH